MRRLVTTILLLMALMAAPAAAQDALAGRWALRSSGRTLMLVDLRPGTTSGVWTGSMQRPDTIEYGSGGAFRASGDAAVRRPLTAVRANDGSLELTVARKRSEQPDRYRLELIASNSAALSITGASIAPLLLVRAAPGEAVANGWDAEVRYIADSDWPSNPELKAMFAADQAGRKVPVIDWTSLSAADATRRTRTKALLDSGKLRSGDDFYHAAFIFQHGGNPGDYLLAHGLSVIAASRGRTDATWIAAATLDRYLQAIGQKQVYGTQYSVPPGKPATQEPYDRQLLSDALRIATGVPPIAEQEGRRADFEAQARARETAK